MFLRRFTFILTCIVLFLCRIISGYPLFGVLLAALLLMAAASLILFLYASASISAEIEMPENAGKNESFSVRIRVHGRAFSDVMQFAPFGHVTNLLTEEQKAFREFLTGDGSYGTLLSFHVQSPRCVQLYTKLESIRITDPFGLFSTRKILEAEASTLISPDTFRVSVELSTPDLPDIESNDYSLIRPGDDPSELFDIRDYREGDPMRQIHWKLSEKYDRTVIREMSLPVSHSILLLLDNSPIGEVLPDAVSDTTEALISLSQSMIDEGIPHQVAWLNHDTGVIHAYTISSPEDLYALQGSLLSCRMISDGTGIVEALLEQDIPEYSHLLLFSAREPQGLDALTNITLFLPQAEPPAGLCCLRELFEAVIL